MLFQNPLNPWAHTELGKFVAAGCGVVAAHHRRYAKPEWGLDETEVNGVAHQSRSARSGRNPLSSAPLRSNAHTVHRACRSSACCWWLDVGSLRRPCCAEPSKRSCRRMTSTLPTGRCPNGTGRRGALDLDDFVDYLIEMLHCSGRKRSRHRCLPTVGPGAGRRVGDGGRARSVCPLSMTLMGGPVIPARIRPRSQFRRRKGHRLVPQ